MTDHIPYAIAIALCALAAWDYGRRRLHNDARMDAVEAAAKTAAEKYQRAMEKLALEMREAIGERQQGQPDLSSRVQALETNRGARAVAGNQGWRHGQ